MLERLQLYEPKVTGALQMPLQEKSIQHVLVKVLTSFSVQLEEQHILWGWELLCCWTWPLQCKEFALLEPALLYQLEVVSADSDWPHKALEQLLAGKCRLLCPIWSLSPNHWTLLEGERASPDEPWSLTYRDSLHPPSEKALKQARTVAALPPCEPLFSSFVRVRVVRDGIDRCKPGTCLSTVAA